VAVQNNGTTVARYSYDGLGRRIMETRNFKVPKWRFLPWFYKKLGGTPLWLDLRIEGKRSKTASLAP